MSLSYRFCLHFGDIVKMKIMNSKGLVLIISNTKTMEMFHFNHQSPEIRPIQELIPYLKLYLLLSSKILKVITIGYVNVSAF